MNVRSVATQSLGFLYPELVSRVLMNFYPPKALIKHFAEEKVPEMKTIQTICYARFDFAPETIFLHLYLCSTITRQDLLESMFMIPAKES